MWRRIWLVAARDYGENVRTKAFLLGVFLFPALLALLGTVPILLERMEREQKPFAVLDRAGGQYAKALRDALGSDAAAGRKFAWQDPPPGADATALARLVDRGALFAFVEIPADVIDGGAVTYAAKTIAYEDLKRWVHDRLDADVRQARITRAGIDPALVQRLQAPVQISELAVGAAGATAKVGLAERVRGKYAPMVFVYLLSVAIMTVAQMLLMSVIEEKSSRIFEILLSSLGPGELMAGKILGSAATGVTLLACWILSFYVFADYALPAMFPDAPKLEVLLEALARIVTWRSLAFFVGYFLLGFLLWASCFAAVGSLLNSVKEAQNLIGPLMMVMLVPVLTMTFVTQNPGDPIGVVLSWIPPFTPFVMLNRVTAIPSAPLWEIVGTLLLLLVSVAAAFAMAGRVFRVGILMTGKPPSLREIWRILRSG